MSNASEVVETPTPVVETPTARPVSTARDVLAALQSRPLSPKKLQERRAVQPVRTKPNPSAGQVVEQGPIPVWARPIEPQTQTTD